MLEGLILMAAVASAPVAARPGAETPPPELLEFIGEWSDEEAAHFLDGDGKPRKTSRLPRAEPHHTTEPADDR